MSSAGRSAVLFLALGLGLACSAKPDKPPDAAYEPRAGDVLFQALPKTVDLVVAIEGVTKSNYSHCGVVIKAKDGNWRVFESIGNVGSVPLRKWVARGRKAKFAAFRLKPEHNADLPAFLAVLPKYAGRPYDFRYRMDDRFIYCSELV